MIKVTEREIFDILTGKISGIINRTLLKAFSREGIDITTEQWTVLSCLWRKTRLASKDLRPDPKDKPSVTPYRQPERKIWSSGYRIRLIGESTLSTSRPKEPVKAETTKAVRHVVNTAVEGILTIHRSIERYPDTNYAQFGRLTLVRFVEKLHLQKWLSN